MIQSYDASGGVLNTFLKKSSLYALKPEIHRGISPDYLERVAYEGILIYAEGKLFYLNKRFGDVAKIDLANAKLAVKSIVPLMSKAEKAKADENRRMFLEEGYDLEKNEGNIPHNYLFEDARIWHGRLFLLLENFDILEKKPRQFTEIIEIDLESWTVVNSYRAMAAAKNESASNILILGDGKEPEFLMTIRVPGDDSKLWIFRPER